ncbi:LiaF-related protein [Haloarculaceae archaeon H-GB1-1]|nr:LiaF-related protein [Haloarculaceae archaeon H-GB1-1]
MSISESDDRWTSTDEFTGAEIVAIFDDAEHDLLDAAICSQSAVVEVASVVGDVELRVPANRDVRLETLAIFGDTIDRRRRQADSDDTTTEPCLIVTVVAILGNIGLVEPPER